MVGNPKIPKDRVMVTGSDEHYYSMGIRFCLNRKCELSSYLPVCRIITVNAFANPVAEKYTVRNSRTDTSFQVPGLPDGTSPALLA